MKKGFTLIELLAVIAILAVLAAISVPAVAGNITKAKTRAYNQLVANIEKTTQLYIRNNKEVLTDLNNIDDQTTITLQDLADKEGLKTPVINPMTKAEIPLTTTITITLKAFNKYDLDIAGL